MRELFCSVSHSGPVWVLSFLPLAASPCAALNTSSLGNYSVPARYRYGHLVGGGPSGLQMCTIEASCDAGGLTKLELESSCTDMLHSGSDVCLDLAIVRRPIAEGWTCWHSSRGSAPVAVAAIGGADHTVTLLDLANGKRCGLLIGNEGHVCSLLWHEVLPVAGSDPPSDTAHLNMAPPDLKGRLILLGGCSNGAVLCWDAAQGTRLRVLYIHTRPVTALRAHGRRLVSVSGAHLTCLGDCRPVTPSCTRKSAATHSIRYQGSSCL